MNKAKLLILTGLFGLVGNASSMTYFRRLVVPISAGIAGVYASSKSFFKNTECSQVTPQEPKKTLVYYSPSALEYPSSRRQLAGMIDDMSSWVQYALSHSDRRQIISRLQDEVDMVGTGREQLGELGAVPYILARVTRGTYETSVENLAKMAATGLEKDEIRYVAEKLKENDYWRCFRNEVSDKKNKNWKDVFDARIKCRQLALDFGNYTTELAGRGFDKVVLDENKQ